MKCYHNELTDDKGNVIKKCPFKLTMLIIFFAFSIVSVVVSFFAYRIFKAQAMGRLGGAMVQGGVLNQGDQNRAGDDEAPRANYLPPPAAYRA